MRAFQASPAKPVAKKKASTSKIGAEQAGSESAAEKSTTDADSKKSGNGEPQTQPNLAPDVACLQAEVEVPSIRIQAHDSTEPMPVGLARSPRGKVISAFSLSSAQNSTRKSSRPQDKKNEQVPGSSSPEGADAPEICSRNEEVDGNQATTEQEQAVPVNDEEESVAMSLEDQDAKNLLPEQKATFHMSREDFDVSSLEEKEMQKMSREDFDASRFLVCLLQINVWPMPYLLRWFLSTT